MNIKIEHIISSTSKEIYEFSCVGDNEWRYKGIMYSNRDDSKDKWGEKWGKKEKEKEILTLAKKLVNKYDPKITSTKEILRVFYAYYEEDFEYEVLEIENKWMPTCNKTKHGLTRYYGSYPGDTPKISKEEIKEKISKTITKNIKVFLK